MVPLFPMSAKVTALRGVGPAFAEALAGVGIETVRDLLFNLPYRYVDRGGLVPIRHLDTFLANSFQEREAVTVLGAVSDIRTTVSSVQRMPLTEALLEDDTGRVRLLWFNQPYLAKALRKGDRILAFGPVVRGRHGLELRSPAFEVLGRAGDKDEPWVRRYLPLYRKMGPLTSRSRGRLCQEALSKIQPPEEFLPRELAAGLPLTLDALRLLHQPQDDADPRELEAHHTPAHTRLALEEMFAFALGVVIRRSGRLARRGVVVPTSAELRETLHAMLPFRLTGAQREAFREIVGDLTSGKVMHRLLQGDVGSGKTLVAFLSMAMVAETDGQAALLAPTEVLARQHAISFQRLLGERADRMQLLLGPMKAAEKRAAMARIASGEARYVVGTHAIFQEAVDFAKLQLVVVDEQHRFGVKQREALKAKGGDPHWLVMSATPIPRSLALALFGDLEQSVLDELPPGRQPISTALLHPDDAERAWRLVEGELAKGHQVYVVSPAIDPSDESKVPLRDIQAMEAVLRGRFHDVPLEVVHGRLKADAMAERMGRFVSGEAKILLATTVIEVGVDVPNATVMVVDHAERFGLSQLHQLRGRVGRGKAHSHFAMLSGSETERLHALVETRDGFKIAQRDLELRGPGEFFGTRQSGLPSFQVADLVRDRGLLQRCRDAAEKALAMGLTDTQKTWLRQEQARLRLAEIS